MWQTLKCILAPNLQRKTKRKIALRALLYCSFFFYELILNVLLKFHKAIQDKLRGLSHLTRSFCNLWEKNACYKCFISCIMAEKGCKEQDYIVQIKCCIFCNAHIHDSNHFIYFEWPNIFKMQNYMRACMSQGYKIIKETKELHVQAHSFQWNFN